MPAKRAAVARSFRTRALLVCVCVCVCANAPFCRVCARWYAHACEQPSAGAKRRRAEVEEEVEEAVEEEEMEEAEEEENELNIDDIVDRAEAVEVCVCVCVCMCV